ncbi:hypothetical protein ACFL5S_00790, partial [Fibrobacterota bacterium]
MNKKVLLIMFQFIVFCNIFADDGYVSVTSGVNVSPIPVTLGQQFSVSFTLEETNGAPITFEKIAIAILKSDDSHLFDLKTYDNKTFTANENWNKTEQGTIFTNNPLGTYKAVIRGKVAGGNWFDFSKIDPAVNPKSFQVVAPTGFARISEGINLSVEPVTLDENFTVDFT